MSVLLVIEVEVKINVPEKVFNILREAGRLDLIERAALDGIEALLEGCSLAELLDL